MAVGTHTSRGFLRGEAGWWARALPGSMTVGSRMAVWCLQYQAMAVPGLQGRRVSGHGGALPHDPGALLGQEALGEFQFAVV